MRKTNRKLDLAGNFIYVNNINEDQVSYKKNFSQNIGQPKGMFYYFKLCNKFVINPVNIIILCNFVSRFCYECVLLITYNPDKMSKNLQNNY